MKCNRCATRISVAEAVKNSGFCISCEAAYRMLLRAINKDTAKQEDAAWLQKTEREIENAI